jgi:O-antigen/teichoic acid export membrane protein
MPAEPGVVPVSHASPLPARLARYLPAFIMAASRAGAVGLQLAVQVAVGALSGPAGLGLLQLFTSWTCIAGEILARGLPASTMRLTAVAWEREDTAACRGQLRFAVVKILRGSAVGLPVALIVLLLVQAWGSLSLVSPMGLALVSVAVAAPLFALLRLGADALKAVDAALQAITLENLVAPAVMLLVCALFWLRGEGMGPVALLGAGIAGFALAMAALWRALLKRLPQPVQPAAAVAQGSIPASETRALWANSVLSILFMHLPFLLLPWFADPAEIGVFAVAHKLVNIITTLLILLAAVFAPSFARAAGRQDRDALRTLLWQTQCLSLAIFVPLIGFLLVAGGQLTGLFNLPENSLLPYIVALAAGQLVNAATGLPGVLLNMAGAARRELNTLLAALAFAALLAPGVGAFYGAEGIAWLFSAALALKNLASFAVARHHLKYWSTTQ